MRELHPPPLSNCLVRLRCTISGRVQGVGFRPRVCVLAHSLGVTGFVGNDTRGVFIEVQGPAPVVSTFIDYLHDCTSSVVVEDIRAEELPPRLESEFVIVSSEECGSGALIPPDLATCDDCLRDLRDSGDRRFGYPLVTCARCGPRFTLIREMPFDRVRTTMANFEMCPRCAVEYSDPKDRRFHAQTLACPICGPRVWFARVGGEEIEGALAIQMARDALVAGLIIAVKGVGGFHLACDATNEATVCRLRTGKARGDKPFALMATSVEMVRVYAEVSPEEERLLTSRERPIVLLRRREPATAASLSRAVAPGNNYLGVMLPYSPLHHLLLGDRPLVMTSGNVCGEPIITANSDASTLAPPADAFLLHNREIITPCDDSVVRVFADESYPIRRSRGYAPLPVRLREGGPTVLAVGGELKATFCLAVGDRAFVSQHIGDLGNLATLATFEKAVEHLMRLLRVEPEAVACDAHPNYASVRWAEAFALRRGLPLVRVQHHRGHIASLAVEHQHVGPLIGVCFDGTGYGDGGTVWGGEFFVGKVESLERVAHVDYIPLPGGDAAVERPYRMALAHLWSAGIPWNESLPCVRACPLAERKILLAQLQRNVNCVPTSSVGRLFDAVAALIGVRQIATYEAQAAIELEAVAEEVPNGYDIPLNTNALLRFDPRSLLRQVASDWLGDVPVPVIAGRFHRGLADSVVRVCGILREQRGVNAVGLTGGVFQNMLLLRLTVESLQRDGFAVLVHRQVPANDGGLSLGQAVLARAALAANTQVG